MKINSNSTSFAYDSGGGYDDSDLMTDIGDDELDWDLNGQFAKSVTASLEYNWSGKLRSATFGTEDEIKLKYDPLGNHIYPACHE